MELAGGESVINEAYPVYFWHNDTFLVFKAKLVLPTIYTDTPEYKSVMCHKRDAGNPILNKVPLAMVA